jgi:citrate lyase subunit beta/citryl-CoA lyase
MTQSSRPIAALLFMPAGARKFIAKAVSLAVDAIVLDLEDATPPGEKAAARAGLADAATALRDATAQRFVRVNGPLTQWFHEDLLALRGLAFDGIVIPKVESRRDLEVARALSGIALPGGPQRIVVGVETLPGVTALADVLATGWADAAYFGAEDLAADFGFGPSVAPDVSHARAEVALLARRHGVSAIDRAVVDVRDAEAFAADARAGRSLGYTGKICLTPGQALAAQATFRPPEADIAWAREVLKAYEAALVAGSGVTTVGANFVDEAIARRARRVLALAGIAVDGRGAGAS